jgi:hypothetical protein
MPRISIGPIAFLIGRRSTPFGTPFAIEWCLAPKHLIDSDERNQRECSDYAPRGDSLGHPDGDQIIVEVQDRGRGMSSESSTVLSLDWPILRWRFVFPA